MTLEKIPFNSDYYFLWHPLNLFRRKYPAFDLLPVEESGKGKEFLKILDVEGWKVCCLEDFPSFRYPHVNGVIMNESEVLCYKKK